MDNDQLDGCCDLDCDNGPAVSDDDAPFLALFATLLDADLNVTDEQALAIRVAEWHELGAGR